MQIGNSDCERMNLLKKLSRKPEPLICSAHNITKCWCNKLKTRIPKHDFLGDECLSPQELLNSVSACFCAEDVAYLKSLAGREFICD